MHTRRAGRVAAQPLNCGVRRLMTRFAVIMHVRGPFKEPNDSAVYDGAYTCRFVRAENAEAASAAAIDALRAEPKFQSFRSGSMDDTPRVEIEQIRSAGWLEGRRGVPGYIFYDESSENDAKTKVMPRASA
jgi:hypothetical protein